MLDLGTATYRRKLLKDRLSENFGNKCISCRFEGSLWNIKSFINYINDELKALENSNPRNIRQSLDEETLHCKQVFLHKVRKPEIKIFLHFL